MTDDTRTRDLTALLNHLCEYAEGVHDDVRSCDVCGGSAPASLGSAEAHRNGCPFGQARAVLSGVADFSTTREEELAVLYHAAERDNDRLRAHVEELSANDGTVKVATGAQLFDVLRGVDAMRRLLDRVHFDLSDRAVAEYLRECADTLNDPDDMRTLRDAAACLEDNWCRSDG